MSTTTAPVDSGTYAVLQLDAIVSSRTNPRKYFDDAKLVELANSITAIGVHTPVLVRPLPAARLQETFADREKGTPLPTHELVAGERRWRASKLAPGVTTIPALVRNLTDDQVLEIQLVENLQREDLQPMEEAEGYQALMEATGITADEVAAKIGKSRSYVYGRLKLLDLCTEAKDALRKNEIDCSRAERIARIPSAKLQIKALKEAARKGYDGAPALSVRVFEAWLRDNVMLRLERAPFSITDAKLCPDAGSCKQCPKRTGANPELFADVDSADVCTDPPCYGKKATAHRDALVKKAEAKGMQVIEGKEAKEICKQYSSELVGYTRLDQKRRDVSEEAPTLRSLIGKDVKAVLIENPHTKELIEAVPTEEAEALLVARGAIKAATQGKATQLDAKIEALKEMVDRRVAQQVRPALYAAVASAVRASKSSPAELLTSDAMLRAWLLEQLDISDDAEVWVTVLGGGSGEFDEFEQIEARIQRLTGADLQRAALLWMAGDEGFGFFQMHRKAQECPMLRALAPLVGVDVEAVIKAQIAAVRNEVNAEIKKLKADAKPPKPPPANAPAAQASKGEKGKPAGAAKAKPKLSAEEASSGIATAMQGLEEPAAAAGSLLGKRVCVNATAHGPQQKGWVGKEGTVREQRGDRAWDVCFPPKKKGGVAEFVSFDTSELEVVE